MQNLGFGTMRLPMRSSKAGDFDFEELDKMVDEFLEAGFTYFDTSFVYHDGHSESAVKKALVERHPRDSFTIATKFPTFLNIEGDQIEKTFEQQLQNLGVDYVDYYLLHNIQTLLYDGLDGRGGIIKKTDLFSYPMQWKEEGKIRHFGFSFHSSAALLDRILDEHPEVEFVQIALNPIDWDSEWLQAGKCYEVIRRHGKKAVIMETIKGGGLAKLNDEAEQLLLAKRPESSIASWALQFALDLEDVIAVLSGMSTLAQLRDNVKTAKTGKPLSDDELDTLWTAMRLYRDSGPVSLNEIKNFEGMTWNGIPTTGLLQAYSICSIQPDPGFTDDGNYLKNVLAEYSHLDINGKLPAQKSILPNGKDATELVDKAVAWLIEHAL